LNFFLISFIFKKFLKLLLNPSILRMNPPLSDLTRGELLRNLREAQGMEPSELARQVNLSVGQLLQLEAGDLPPGERSLFYTPTIKEKAAIKVIQALGADPQTLSGAQALPSGPEAGVNPDLKILDDLAVLLKKQAQAREMGAGDRHFSWKWVFGAFGALWLAGAVGYYGQSVSSWLNIHKPFVTSAVAAPVKLPEPAQIEATAASSVVATPPEGTVAAQDAAAGAQALCDNPAPQTTLSASQPSKSGGSVHVVAQADLVMCVRDGSGKSMPVNLKAQESRTFWGKAPWSLRIEKPVPMHMFFQGQKIYWPEGDVSGVILKEVAGDY
jgi:DNA-binding transcriptional ArsR family regulator